MIDSLQELVASSNGFADLPTTYRIRISETAFIASTATFLVIALLVAFLRTILRWRRFHRLAADDLTLLFACACLGAVAGVAWTIKDLVYLQIHVGLGWEAPGSDFYARMLVFEKRVVAASALVWAAIYAVKASFLLFFGRLINCVRPLEIQWWVVAGFLVAGAAVSVPLAFVICPHYGEDYMDYCPVAAQIAHERAYLQASVAIDVLTDVLLVSIPVRMLWGLQMSRSKKAMICLLLSLSLFMVAIAIVRTAAAPLPNGVVDTSWLVFWQGMEAVVAVLMVSLTAFPGLFAAEHRQVAPGGSVLNRRRAQLSPGNMGRAPQQMSGKMAGDAERQVQMMPKRTGRLHPEESVLLTTVLSSRDAKAEIVVDEKAVVQRPQAAYRGDKACEAG